MKRLVFALAAIGLTASLSAYAAVPTGAQATDVNVPVDQAGFFLGGSALYLQPSISGNDLNYSTTPNADNSYTKINNIDPSYNWGFDVFGGYNFGNGNDLSLKYTRLHTSDSETAAEAPVDNVNYASKGDADINLDQVDLLAGQQVNIGCAHKLHLFGGLRYAKLDRDLDINRTASGIDGNNNAFSRTANTVEDDSDFKGIGPIIGADGTYYLGYGVGLVAGVDTGLLVGKANDTYTLTNYEATPTTVTNIETDSHRRVVPVADAKLGVDYTFPFQNYGSLTAEAGWKISQYWNAVDSISTSQPNLTQQVVPAVTSISTSTNSVSYQGPYVTLTYRGIPTL